MERKERERKAGNTAEARILFQPRQRDKPGVWGRAPSGVQGQIPWSGGQGAKPHEAERFSVVGWPKEMENLLKFSYFTTYSLFSKCCGDVLFFYIYFVSDVAVFVLKRDVKLQPTFT